MSKFPPKCNKVSGVRRSGKRKIDNRSKRMGNHSRRNVNIPMDILQYIFSFIGIDHCTQIPMVNVRMSQNIKICQGQHPILGDTRWCMCDTNLWSSLHFDIAYKVVYNSRINNFPFYFHTNHKVPYIHDIAIDVLKFTDIELDSRPLCCEGNVIKIGTAPSTLIETELMYASEMLISKSKHCHRIPHNMYNVQRMSFPQKQWKKKYGKNAFRCHKYRR